jgi:hypothetical protein
LMLLISFICFADYLLLADICLLFTFDIYWFSYCWYPATLTLFWY